MKQIFQFWPVFRLVQVYRMLSTAGWGMLLFALLLTGLFWVRLFTVLSDLNWWQIGLVAFASIGVLHLQRRDIAFLHQSQWPFWQFCLIDYGLLVFPFLVIAGFGGRWSSIPTICVALIWAFVPRQVRLSGSGKTVRFKLSLVPPLAYEWYGIIRNSWPIIVLAWLLYCGILIHIAFFVAGSFVLLLAVLSGFGFLGPATMQPTSTKTIIRHWRLSASILHLFMGPGYVLGLLLQPAWWPMLLYIALCAEGFVLACLAAHIRAWQPQRRRMDDVVLSIQLLIILIPGGILAVWGWAGWLCYKLRVLNTQK